MFNSVDIRLIWANYSYFPHQSSSLKWVLMKRSNLINVSLRSCILRSYVYRCLPLTFFFSNFLHHTGWLLLGVLNVSTYWRQIRESWLIEICAAMFFTFVSYLLIVNPPACFLILFLGLSKLQLWKCFDAVDTVVNQTNCKAMDQETGIFLMANWQTLSNWSVDKTKLICWSCYCFSTKTSHF